MIAQLSKGLGVKGNTWFFVVPPVDFDTRNTRISNELFSLKHPRSVWKKVRTRNKMEKHGATFEDQEAIQLSDIAKVPVY